MIEANLEMKEGSSQQRGGLRVVDGNRTSTAQYSFSRACDAKQQDSERPHYFGCRLCRNGNQGQQAGVSGYTLSWQLVFALVLPLLNVRAETPIQLSRIAYPFTSRNESRLAALIRFGRENQLCFGIEFSDERFNDRPVLQLPRTTIRKAVEAILLRDQDDSLTLSVRKGVILVRSNRSPSPHWLEYRLPRFRILRTQLVWAGVNLWMVLERRLRPSIEGFAGDFPPGDPADQVGPIDIQDATIRDLLCAIVGASRRADWVVTAGFTLASRKNESINRYWTLLYDSGSVLSRPVVPLRIPKVP